MIHSLLCPNQCEDNWVRIDLRPKVDYKYSSTASTVNCYDAGLKIKHNINNPYRNLIFDIQQVTSFFVVI